MKGPKHFCDGRVYPAGGRGHIHWDAYYSTRPVEVAVAHYMKVCGRENHKGAGKEHSWSFPLGRPTAVLSVSPHTAKGPWYTCKLPKKARSIILISHFPR